MKALLIADDEKAITNISEVLKTAGYDVIVYKWLLKAMDNIEEIAPHLIVISTKDYPRHWKTLAQFSTTIAADYTPEIILYAEEPLSEQEEKKAVALHVRGIFDSCEVEGLDTLRKILAKKKDIFSGLLTEPEQSEVTLQDLLPELSDLSKDIDSLKEDLKKPFNIDEAIAQAKKAQTEEVAEEAEKKETLQDNEQKENQAQSQAQNPSETEEEIGAETIPDEAVSEETVSPEIKTPEENSETEFNAEENGENELCQNEDKKEKSEPQITGNQKNAETEIPDTEISDKLESSPKATPENQDVPFSSAQESDFQADEKESSAVEVEEEIAEKESEVSDKSCEESFQSDLAKTENIEAQVKSDIIEEKSEKEDSEMNENDIEAKLAAIMSANKTEAKEKASETGIGKFSCSFAFTNPITLAMVTGTARNYNGLTLEFTPDIPSFIANLAPGTKIDVASLKINGEISDVKCEIMSNDSDKIYLQIKSK